MESDEAKLIQGSELLTPNELNHNDFRWQTEQSDKTQFINKTQNLNQ